MRIDPLSGSRHQARQRRRPRLQSRSRTGRGLGGREPDLEVSRIDTTHGQGHRDRARRERAVRRRVGVRVGVGVELRRRHGLAHHRHEVVKTIKVGVEPNGLSAIGRSLWVTDHTARQARSASTRGRTASPGSVALSGADWVTSLRRLDLRLAGDEPRRAGRPHEPEGARRACTVKRNPLGSALVGGELWVPCIDANAIDVIDPRRCEVVARSRPARGPIVVLPVGGHVWVSHTTGNRSGASELKLLGVELTDYRDRFPILESTTYLINHSLGAMPAEARACARAVRARVGDARGARVGRGLVGLRLPRRRPARPRSSARRPGSTVMHQNVTVAEAIVLSCFDLKPPRNRIVFEEGLFPSVRYVQQAWSRFGAEVVVCPDAEAVIDAIDERTLLVPISHVLYKTAEIQPVERDRASARSEAGAHVCLDAYQSAGAVPLDVTALGIDFCVGGSVKWLCGGPGAGWLYVRPDLAEELEPAFAGWQAHARPFAFETEMDPAAGRGALPDRHADRGGELRGERGLRDHRGDRRRPDPRELDAADRAARRAVDEAGLRADVAARARAARRLGRLSRARTSRRCTPSSRGADHLRLRGRTSACASARTSSRPTTSSGSPSSQVATSSTPARTSSAHARGRRLLERDAEGEQRHAARAEDGRWRSASGRERAETVASPRLDVMPTSLCRSMRRPIEVGAPWACRDAGDTRQAETRVERRIRNIQTCRPALT